MGGAKEMRNVNYDFDSNSGYACAECGEPINPDEMFADEWHCGHSAAADAVIVEIVSEGLK